MTSTVAKLVRPAAAAVAVVLVAGAVPATPAVAASTPYFLVWGHAVYPYDEVPGYWGDDPRYPADARVVPGSVTLSVQVQNDGDAIHGMTVASTTNGNGQVQRVRCATTPIFVDDVWDPTMYDGFRQSAPRAAAPSWTDPDLVLPPGEHLYCAVDVSAITDTTLSEIVTTATVDRGTDRGRYVTEETHLWAAAGDLRPPPPPPVSVGQAAWIDKNDDGSQQTWHEAPDTDLNEPGIPGLHLTITGPDGKPVRSYPSGQGVISPLVTDKHGSYRFDHLRPYVNPYTVTLDLRSPALAGLVKSRHARGTVSPDGSTWSIKTHLTAGDDQGLNFRFVPKNLLGLTIRAPYTVIAGSAMTVTGRAERADVGAWDGPVVLETRLGGTSTWTKVADTTSHQGSMAVKVRPVRAADYRFRSPGDRDTPAAVSPEFHTLVYLAPATMTMQVPDSVREGAPFTITGTVTRAGKPFQTGRVVLQYAPDGFEWETLAHLRSTKGKLTVTVPSAREGLYRLLYLGDSKTYEAWDDEWVDVTPARTPSPSPRPSR